MRIALVLTERPGEAGAADPIRRVLDRLGPVSVIEAPAGRAQAIDDAIAARFRAGDADLWVFFGAEDVAAALVAAGLRGAVVVPAPDADRDDLFWGRLALCRFVTFSFAQHARLQALGLASHVFSYWPAADAATGGKGADDAFFHERRPLGVPNVGTVAQQCAVLGISRLRVRAAPDRPGEGGGWSGLTVGGVAISVVEGAEADEAERTASVVFAPTVVAPIAGAHLDAMARGQVVVAPDRAPANEAIGHLSSGLLYDPDRPLALPPLTAALAETLSAGARLRAAEGRRALEADAPRLASVIAGDNERWPSGDPSATFLREVQRAVRRRRLKALTPR